MATPTKDYRYTVEFNIHAVDAPGTRLVKKGDIYLNICLLGLHKRTRLMPAHLPMHVDQRLYFEKIFKFCYEPDDIIQRLEREHILIELIQNDFPSPILLASYEVRAKDFLYPHSSHRIEYTGLRRYILLTRTVDFPGISPSLEFSTSPSIDDVTGLTLGTTKTRRETRSTKRSFSPSWKPSSAYPTRSSLNGSLYSSRPITSHTISSAIKNDYGQLETKEKIRELTVDRTINYVTPTDKTRGRPPFVVRHVNNNLIGRKPEAHTLFKDDLVINDYTLARAESTTRLASSENDLNRSRSLSPSLGRSFASMTGRSRSPSPSRRSPRLTESSDFEVRGRTLSPSRYLYNDYDNYSRDYDTDTNSPPYHPMSFTLQRDSFRRRYGYSPAADLSDRIINTLRRNLSSYSARPLYRYYPPYPYIDGYTADELLA